MNNKKVGIIGATGYTGSELVRLLYSHPDVDIGFITSESKAGESFSDIHSFFSGLVNIELLSVKDIDRYDVDLVFLALPHGVSMDYVKKFQDKSFKMIDLSGDFRLSNKKVYETWYNSEHIYPKGFDDAVFGLPELNTEEIRDARFVANPGCYPTSSILGTAPLVNHNLIVPTSIIIDAKSGVTGAGVKPKSVNHFSNVNDNFKAYGLIHHRHTIEIQEQLNILYKDEITVQFTPHLLPVDRGILSTIYSKPQSTVNEEKLKSIYRDFYEDSPFVRVRNTIPGIKDVRGTNYCDLFVTYDERTNNIIVVSVIDNLVKGAAGQAIQNMNLMLDMAENTGLNQIPLNP